MVLFSIYVTYTWVHFSLSLSCYVHISMHIDLHLYSYSLFLTYLEICFPMAISVPVESGDSAVIYVMCHSEAKETTSNFFFQLSTKDFIDFYFLHLLL